MSQNCYWARNFESAAVDTDDEQTTNGRQTAKRWSGQVKSSRRDDSEDERAWQTTTTATTIKRAATS